MKAAEEKTEKKKRSPGCIVAILILIVAAILWAVNQVPGTTKSTGPTSAKNVPENVIPAAGPPVKINGRGQTATELISLPSPISRAIFQHSGTSNFIVTAYLGNDKNLLINEIGNYKGAVLVISNEKVMFDIDADSTWNLTVEGISKTSSASFTGKGDNVSGYFTPPQQGAWQISHSGDSNFVVRYHCIGGSDLIVNEIGALSDSTIIAFDEGPCFWEVNADGSWSLQPK